MSAGNVTDLQCGEGKSIKDDDSVISDRCWQEIHRGDSRKWLIRDASRQKMDSTVCSTMKSSYLYPVEEKREGVVGRWLPKECYLHSRWWVFCRNTALFIEEAVVRADDRRSHQRGKPTTAS